MSGFSVTFSLYFCFIHVEKAAKESPDVKNWLSGKPWCCERLKAGGEGIDRGWGGWMASPTQRTWIWAISRSWWRTRKPGVTQPMGSQRVKYDWMTELNWTERITNLLTPMGMYHFTTVLWFGACLMLPLHGFVVKQICLVLLLGKPVWFCC